MDGSARRSLAAALALVLLLAAGALGACARSATAGWVTYSRPVYGVTLEHPPGWRPVPGYDESSERHGGKDGFFQLGAAAVVGPGAPPPPTLDDVAREEASHKLKPYGSRPTSERLRVAGREPRLR